MADSFRAGQLNALRNGKSVTGHRSPNSSVPQPEFTLFVQRNRAHAQLICRVIADGGQNLRMITLIEAEHIRVE